MIKKKVMNEKGRKWMIMTVLAAVGMIVAGMGATMPVMAQNEFTKEACSSITDADQKQALGCNDGGQQVPGVAINLIKVVLGIIGVVTVVMIIVAGQRYMTAQGDPGKIQQAKNMIIYSVVGLVVAILAFAIVVFVENTVLEAEDGTETSQSTSYVAVLEQGE